MSTVSHGAPARPHRRGKRATIVDDLDPRWDVDFLAECAVIEEHYRHLEQIAAAISERLKLTPPQIRKRRVMAELTFDEQEAIEHVAARIQAERLAEVKASRQRAKARLRRRQRKAQRRLAAKLARAAAKVNRAVQAGQPSQTEPSQAGREE